MAGFGSPDRLKAAIAAVVRSIVGNTIVGARVDYLASYSCAVVAQNPDGTLELKPDDARLPTFSSVPIKPGLAGATMTVQPGARGFLRFGAGDPQRPYLTDWESATVILLNLPCQQAQIGASATDFAALASRVDANFSNQQLWNGTHTHPTDVGPSGTAVPPASPVATGSATIKIQP